MIQNYALSQERKKSLLFLEERETQGSLFITVYVNILSEKFIPSNIEQDNSICI